ncbi:M64 family metallopeptidase [Candidatus Uabimicrobium sp. HlEnr_7]|uniref:M64 family metallopeptidase n=1 Tax=Candidatus Uabimicrobium helgolandensis TaxID=3095367 RepID=UPI003558B669
MFKYILFVALIISTIICDPCPEEKVRKNPRDLKNGVLFASLPVMTKQQIFDDAKEIVRVEVEWIEKTDSYRFAYAVIEKSGTTGLLKRTKNLDTFGSYRGQLVDTNNNILYYNSLGTGQEYRKLSRSLTFRFPIPSSVVEFQMIAENPQTGTMEHVLTHTIDPQALTHLRSNIGFNDIEVRLIKAANKSPKLIVNIYAEGYNANGRSAFWQDAPKVADRLASNNFPMIDHLEFRGVFAVSQQKLGSAKKLGFPVPERDSFLGLYYPYWDDFGRWYHVIYPTREKRFRENIGLIPYDYPIVLVDSSSYWGVGNFKEHTAIPARSSSFTYLLLHEFGHYFGLNEEYDSGGKTELAFAPGIREPWSPNITFLNNKDEVKWKRFTTKGIPIPTPKSYWNGKDSYGAYRGGYAQTPPFDKSYKPGFKCIMDSGNTFCEICRFSITQRIRFDLGLETKSFSFNNTQKCCE